MDFYNIEQIKKLDINSASEYCEELRKYVIENVSKSGGHLASNLGVAEISLALVRLFDSPNDKIIYDVGHQSYFHKLLTGRYFDYTNIRTFGGFSGFTKRDESVHDPFGAGHSSTALSAAVGFAKACKLKGDNHYAVAVIGDGAFCTGMSFEALNNISSDDKIIIVLNDNEMSISPNVGSMSAYLRRIRVTKKYLSLKRKTKNVFSKVPLVSRYLTSFASNTKKIIKSILIKNTIFENLGMYYLGPADGNDLKTVESILQEAKCVNAPVLVHFITKKGKGVPEAEQNPNKYHFVSPSCDKANENTFSKEFARNLISFAEKNEKSVAITAAMCDGTGLTAYKNKFPERFFDVGICEEHAATFSAALSASGILPFYTVYSTFFQRSYDQILHDAVLQNLKMVVALDRAGLVGADGPTHHGLFDVSMMLNLPNTAIYSPATFNELEYSFNECTKHPYVSTLRYPKGCESKLVSAVFKAPGDFKLDTAKKCDILFVTYGRITEEVIKAKVVLEKRGYSVVILKFVKLKPLNFDKINELISSLSPKTIVGVEEGMKIGGFCEYLFSNIKTTANIKTLAIDEKFIPQGTLKEQFDFAGLSAEKICLEALK